MNQTLKDSKSMQSLSGNSMQSKVQQELEQYQHRIIIQKVPQFVISEILETSIVEIVKAVTNIVVFSLYMFHFGYKITADLVFVFPFLEILLVTVPKSGIQASATKLAMFLYHNQITAAKVYTTYLVTLYLIVVIGLQLSVGMFSQTLLQNYVDQAVIDYFKLVLCCGVVSESMQAMLNLFLYAENRIFEQYVLQISQCVLHLIILLVSFLFLDTQNQTEDTQAAVKCAAVARVLSYAVANVYFFYRLFVPISQSHLSYRFSYMSPFRIQIFFVMLRDFIVRFIGDMLIPCVKIAVVIFYKFMSHNNSGYGQLSLIAFQIFIYLFILTNTFTVSAYLSLRHPIDVNKSLNLHHRVYDIFIYGFIISLVLTTITALLLYCFIPTLLEILFVQYVDRDLQYQFSDIVIFTKFSVIPAVVMPGYYFTCMYAESHNVVHYKNILILLSYFMGVALIVDFFKTFEDYDYTQFLFYTYLSQALTGLLLFYYIMKQLKIIVLTTYKQDQHDMDQSESRKEPVHTEDAISLELEAVEFQNSGTQKSGTVLPAVLEETYAFDFSKSGIDDMEELTNKTNKFQKNKEASESTSALV
ncbi:Conserved_hypothetical protein [Hexamita inflata]|uniref:Uncharacterized protein n=1 Tax=Hexamita inflata TaxID=28002 RepID=A0AA86PUM2_9EUKA|nr:Conserved hypothetical protein [Hexamita inflata]